MHSCRKLIELILGSVVLVVLATMATSGLPASAHSEPIANCDVVIKGQSACSRTEQTTTTVISATSSIFATSTTAHPATSTSVSHAVPAVVRSQDLPRTGGYSGIGIGAGVVAIVLGCMGLIFKKRRGLDEE